jgi:hypothetical protein
MSGARLAVVGLAAWGLLGLASTVRGQSLVPGGWSTGIGYQSFVGPGYYTPLWPLGPGPAVSFAPSPFGSPGVLQNGQYPGGIGSFGAESQAVNGLVPLSTVIRQSTFRRSRR